MDKEEQSYTSPPVEAKDKGLRLDKYLAKSFSDFSRAQIQRRPTPSPKTLHWIFAMRMMTYWL